MYVNLERNTSSVDPYDTSGSPEVSLERAGFFDSSNVALEGVMSILQC